jgi:hypothetical protein
LQHEAALLLPDIGGGCQLAIKLVGMTGRP